MARGDRKRDTDAWDKSIEALIAELFDERTCRKCNVSIMNRREHLLSVHCPVDLETAARKYKHCPRCDYSTPVDRDMESHVNRWHEHVKPYTCPHCQEPFYGRNELQHHDRKYHPDRRRVLAPEMQQIYKDWWQKNKIEPAQRAQAESRNDNIVAQQASASLSASDHGGQPSFDASTQAAHSLHRSRIPHPLLFRQPSPVTTPPIATAASSTYSSGPPSGAYTWSHIYRPAPPSASASACSSRQPSVSSSTASTSAWYPVDQGGPSPLSSATYSSRHASMSSTSSVHPPSRSAWPNSDAACTYEPPPVPPSSYHSVVRTFDGQDSPFGANPDAQAGNLAASFVDAQSQYDNSVTEVPSRLLLHPEVQQALRRAAAEIPSTLQHRPEYLEPSRIHGWPPGSSPPPGVPVTPEHPQSLGRYAVPQGQPQSSMPVSMGDGYMVGNYTVAPNMGASNPPGDQWLRPAIDVGTADAYAEDIYGDAPIFDMDDSPSYDPSSALAMLYSEADPNDLAAWVMSLPPMDMRRLDDPSVWDNSESWQ